MKKHEIARMYKNEAFNKIRKIFHPLTQNSYDNYSGESYLEQDARRVSYILEEMEKRLKNLKKEENDNTKIR
jgi:hypothetical protein